MKLYWAKVKDNAKIPTKRLEDAGYDLYPCFEDDYILIAPHETKLIPLGIASAFDSGWVMIIKERGSTGSKGIAQRCGVIDSGYRGEYLAPITNLNTKPLCILKEGATKQFSPQELQEMVVYPYEKALCQGVLLQIPTHESQEISFEALQGMESLRKDGRLGSSQK